MQELDYIKHFPKEKTKDNFLNKFKLCLSRSKKLDILQM
jgi:hypothetical protein